MGHVTEPLTSRERNLRAPADCRRSPTKPLQDFLETGFRQNLRMVRSGSAAIVDPWLGGQYWHNWHGQQELPGSIEIDPAFRKPTLKGSRDA